MKFSKKLNITYLTKNKRINIIIQRINLNY